MALTYDRHRSENTPLGKEARVRAQFDTSYPTGGEATGFTATTPFTGVDAFTNVRQVIADSPKTSTGVPSAVTVCTRVAYDAASGLLVAFRESATGEEAEVPNTTDVSAVYVDLRILGE